jgi:predicted regulator of Ras-like GTPase activity (Roadblock/LC7/MglB family)
MKETLEELKEILREIIGAFVINSDGNVVSYDLPKKIAEQVNKLSKLIYYVVGVMNATRPFERVIIDLGNVKMIAVFADDLILVVMAEKKINLPLFKLVSNLTVTRIKKDRKGKSTRSASPEELTEICDTYDLLFGIVAEKLIDVFGEDSVSMFHDNFEIVKEDHPKLLENVRFGKEGKPKVSNIKMNAVKVSKDELISGLEDILVSMLETLKSTAGNKIADNAIDEIIGIKERKIVQA